MLSASGAWALPKCPSDPNVVWSNCVGSHTFANGDKYVVEFKNGSANGHGTYTFGTGDKYVGEFKDNEYHGRGTFTRADGRKYVGEWTNGTMNGLGIMTLADGTVQEGVFKDGFLQYAQKTPYSSKPSFLQAAFNNLSQLQREQVQSILSNLGFYTASIDGLYGWGTSAALNEYNNQYLNGSDLTNSDNVRRLIDAILSIKIEEPAPPVVSEAKPQDDEVREAASGSGFAVSSDGYVITNNHVIEGCQEVAVYDGGRAVPATVVTYDLQNDLALLKGDFTPKTVFALSDDQPELLQDVYVAGYPFGNEISSSIKVTKGIISSLTGIGNNFSNIQIDAALQVGNSGGPILDEMGNVVGVAVSKLDAKYMYDNFGTIPENTNFGIKASVVRSVLDSNGVSSPSPSTNEITKSELGTRITGGTYYVSCMMTLAQIEVLRTKKVMFENFD